MAKVTIIFASLLLVMTFKAANAENEDSQFVSPEYQSGSLDLFSFYPGGEVSMARTGRVMVTMMVDKEGNTFEPAIERANNDRFNGAALKMVEHSKYEPATLNGMPIDSWVRFTARFNMGYAWNSRYVSTKLFNKHLSNFNEEIIAEKPNVKKLQKYLKKMAGTRHGTPIAYELLSRARYKYLEKFGDIDEQIMGIREMLISSDSGYAIAKNQIADIELIRLLIQSNFYGEAEEAYSNAMYKHKSDIRKSITAQVGASISEVRDLIASDKAFERKIKLNADGFTFLPLVKNVFAFDQIKGNIEKLKLRCKRKYKELKFVADAEYKIPEKWGACQLQIIGDNNTEGRILQL